MITRSLQKKIQDDLLQFPAAAILGPRQVGKTTLAKQLSKTVGKQSVFVDLENPRDLDRLSDAYSFLEQHQEQCVIIDEIQRMPELFTYLRPLIDAYRKPGRFIILGSASPELVKGVSESLAGRIAYSELSPISITELPSKIKINTHWFRGGFPDALLARSNASENNWMNSFVSTYIERDLSELFDTSFSTATMRNFWKMLAHSNAGIWNAQVFAGSLGLTAPTVKRYLDYLEAAFLIRKLPAFYYNSKKRIVKSPKVYLRDGGILHSLLALNQLDDLLGHPIAGASWEGYVVNQIAQNVPSSIELYYYRTQNGAESDLVLVKAGRPVACIEIKLSTNPAISKGFYECINDLKTSANFVITPQGEPYKKAATIIITGIQAFFDKNLKTLI